MLKYIKNFFDKDLLIAIAIFLITLSAFVRFLWYLLIPIIFFFILKSVINNLKFYKSIVGKIIYLIVVISFLLIGFFANYFIYLLFFHNNLDL